MMCFSNAIKKRTKQILLIISLFVLIQPISNFTYAQEGKDLFAVCAACHTIGGGRVIGPDLQGVSERRDEAWLIKFIQNSQAMIQAGDPDAVKIFAEYNNIPMPPNNLTDDQVRTLLAYIENFDKDAVSEEKAEEIVAESYGTYEVEPDWVKKSEARNYGTIFYIALALMLIALVDLFVFRMIKAKFVHIITILICAFIGGEIIVVEAQGLGRQQYYSPDQPIDFSHKVHVGQNKIDCKYCHTSADESIHAGIPSPQLCMNCHTVVKTGTLTGTEEISKISAAIASGKSIEWIKVHNVPDHVFFSHAQHVNAGKVDCKECHGDVSQMDRIIQVNDLSMGWCIDCHRTKEVDFSNEFYKNYSKLHAEINKGKRSGVTVDAIGGNDCQKCHY
jgi:cytochrome c2